MKSVEAPKVNVQLQLSGVEGGWWGPQVLTKTIAILGAMLGDQLDPRRYIYIKNVSFKCQKSEM